MLETIALVCKPHHPKSKEILSRALTYLTQKTVSLVVDKETYDSIPELFQTVSQIQPIPRQDVINSSDLAIVFGGDGTLISVCRHSRTNKTKFAKVLGVNLGNLGYLTEVGPDRLEWALDHYFAGNTKVSPAPLLEIEVLQNGHFKHFALNDVVVNKQALSRIFTLGLKVNEEHAINMRGDGVIISTPNGSTAYSLAAGGSIVHPEVDALLITPICPHSLGSRPIVIPGNATITLELGSESQAKEVYLTIDGQEGMALLNSSKIIIKKSANYVQYLKLPDSEYFANLSNKLRWG